MKKTSVGTWDKDNKGTALRHVEQLNLGWYYNWATKPLWNSGISSKAQFVPMIWGPKNVTSSELTQAKQSSAPELLGFNEPDDRNQAWITPEQALSLWPQLVATGKRLGSPAPTIHGIPWLDKFMAGKPKVDFICVHHYTDNQNVGALEKYLQGVYNRYGLPVWLTEWSLADWNNQGRFSLAENESYAKAALPMLESLPFLERHAWFAMYAGGDGWNINTEVFDSTDKLTVVGQIFKAGPSEVVTPTPTPTPEPEPVPVKETREEKRKRVREERRLKREQSRK